jgi:hypothetical protein
MPKIQTKKELLVEAINRHLYFCNW